MRHLSKRFDYIQHETFIYKLQCYGVMHLQLKLHVLSVNSSQTHVLLYASSWLWGSTGINFGITCYLSLLMTCLINRLQKISYGETILLKNELTYSMDDLFNEANTLFLYSGLNFYISKTQKIIFTYCR